MQTPMLRHSHWGVWNPELWSPSMICPGLWRVYKAQRRSRDPWVAAHLLELEEEPSPLKLSPWGSYSKCVLLEPVSSPSAGLGPIYYPARAHYCFTVTVLTSQGQKALKAKPSLSSETCSYLGSFQVILLSWAGKPHSWPTRSAFSVGGHWALVWRLKKQDKPSWFSPVMILCKSPCCTGHAMHKLLGKTASVNLWVQMHQLQQRVVTFQRTTFYAESLWLQKLLVGVLCL